MSSIQNVQNYLVNCFRPRYQYDDIEGVFRTRLELSNIDEMYGNSINVSNLYVGDLCNNAYVGNNAGNVWSNAISRGTGNTTAVGVSAGTLNFQCANCTYLGFSAGAEVSNASAVIGIGVNAGGSGISNIYIGNGTGSVGNNNIFIGHAIAPISSPPISNTLQIASLVYGNLASKWIGIGTPSSYLISLGNPPTAGMDVSGYTYIKGGLGINASPMSNTLNVNGDARFDDGYGFLGFDSDAQNNTIVDISNRTAGKTARLKVTGTTQATEGVFSVQGSITISNEEFGTIGTIKKGSILISAVDVSDSSHYTSTMIFAPSVGGLPQQMTNILAVDVSVSIDNENIRLENTTGGSTTFNWSITYFPVP